MAEMLNIYVEKYFAINIIYKFNYRLKFAEKNT